jgi:hypothetical protein
MASSNFKNAAPRMVFEGLRDESIRAVPNVPLQVPTHLPIALIRSGWGLEVDQLVAGNQWLDLYGSDVFNERSKYYTHANRNADVINRRGNKQLAIRIVSEDAPMPAGFRHQIEAVAEDIKLYERNSDGTYKVGADGKRIETGQVTRGVKLRHLIEPIMDATGDEFVELGQASQREGTLISTATGEASIIFPVQEYRRPCRGVRGNLGGIRLSAPNIRSAGGTRDDLIERERGFLYRIQFVERPDDRSSPLVKPTIAGEQSVMFSYKDDFFDSKTNVEYGIDQVLMQKYNAEGVNGGPDTVGVFSDYHVYRDDLEALMTMIYNAEKSFGTVGDRTLEEDLHLVNFLTAVSWQGVPYHSVELLGPADGGVHFTENTVHYAVGGGDGDLSAEAFDRAVGLFFDGFDTNEMRLWDPYRVPASVIYDSGFSLETKLKMLRVLGIRDDIWLNMQTQVDGEPLNTEEEDYSIGVAIKNRALSYPESVVHGTEALRCIIVSGAGRRNDFKTMKPISFNLKVADDFANYMGASNGIWNSVASPDEPENNGIRGYTRTNARSKTDPVVDNFWDNGIIYAQYRDRSELFIPAYQTVYPEDTSVLNSAMNMIIAVDVIKECRYV